MYVQRYDFFPNQPRDSWKKSSHKSNSPFKAILSVRNSVKKNAISLQKRQNMTIMTNDSRQIPLPHNLKINYINYYIYIYINIMINRETFHLVS